MTVAERIVDAEEQLLQSLRPETLDSFIGQDHIKQRLRIAIGAAVIENRTIDHVLLTGPKGLGKTSLAEIIARQTGGKLHKVVGTALKETSDIIGLLNGLEEGDTLFIDEIHSVDLKLCEFLYTAMEDFLVNFMGGSGQDRFIIPLPLAPFTLVGATTKKGSVPGPMLDRFGIQLALQFYDVPSLTTIVMRSALVMGIRIDHEAASVIARRSRGTPRIANRWLRRVRDYAVVNNETMLSSALVERSLAIEGVDANGLDELDRQYLQILVTGYGGGPAGVDAIASAMQSDRETLTASIEPELLRSGLLLRESRGRRITLKGMQAIKL